MRNKTIEHLYQVLKLMRLRQWTKNVAIFAAITFGGRLLDTASLPILYNVFWGFVAFCLLSSSSYILNDLRDIEKDRLHPFKKGRPLASGKVKKREAFVLFSVLLVSALTIAFFTSQFFFLIAIFYIVLQFLYSLYFKNIVVFDILIIALGYILRVYAGEVISGFHISVWLLLTTISLSLFLAVCKRRSELNLLTNYKGAKIDSVRLSLTHYPLSLLDSYATLFATSTFIFYSIFTFEVEPLSGATSLDTNFFMTYFIADKLARKWLMITIIPVVYGLMRYMQAIYERNEGEAPEKIFLSDKPLLVAVVIWVVLVILIIDVTPFIH